MSFSIATVIAIYFIIWWVVLFAVLPWGVKSQDESGDVAPGTEPGAPAAHRIGMKLLYTTIAASVVFGILYAIYVFDLIPIALLNEIVHPPHT